MNVLHNTCILSPTVDDNKILLEIEVQCDNGGTIYVSQLSFSLEYNRNMSAIGKNFKFSIFYCTKAVKALMQITKLLAKLIPVAQSRQYTWMGDLCWPLLCCQKNEIRYLVKK